MENNQIDFTEGIDQVKLTEWENEPTIRDLKQDYTDAKPAHDTHVSDVKNWLDLLNVEGKYKRTKSTTRSSITPKLIRKQAEWRYAALSEPFLSTDDLFNTAPETFEDKLAATQAGLVLNNQFNTKLNKVSFVDEYIRTLVDEGSVITRVGWAFEEEEQEVEVPIMELRPVQDPQQYEQMMAEGIEPVEEVQVGTKSEKQMVTTRNEPTAEVCNYNNVIVDPTCLGDVDKMGFLVYSFETNMSELKKDGRYKNLDSININSTTLLSTPDHDVKDPTNFNFKDKARKKFIAHEHWGYWDIDGSGVVKPIVATYVGDTVIRMEENPFPDGKIPFVITSYLPVRKNIYGQPDGELLADNQEIIGAVTRGMIDIMGRSANGQMGIRKDALDLSNKRKFEKGLDYEFNPNTDPRSAFYMHTFNQIPSSAEFILNQQNTEAEALTGVRAFYTNAAGQGLNNTATADRIALDASAKRELCILRRAAEGFKNIGRKIMAMNAVWLSEEETVRVTNEEFVVVRKDDLDGKYDVNLTISTAEADNNKASELSFMLQTMGNNMDPAMSRMILADIAKLRKMPELAKKIEEYQPQPDPLDQELKMLEVELKKAQVFNEQSKGQENAVDVELKKAKTQTELEKGRNLGSKSDMQDLEFLDKDSGVSHERELEKEDFKRKSDLDKIAATSMLSPKPEKKEN